MTEMIRKQFYIRQRHQRLLKRLAAARGISEAEVVRQAIEHEAAGSYAQPAGPERDAWEQTLEFVATRKKSQEGVAYRWDREDAYSDSRSLRE